MSIVLKWGGGGGQTTKHFKSMNFILCGKRKKNLQKFLCPGRGGGGETQNLLRTICLLIRRQEEIQTIKSNLISLSVLYM